MALAIRRLGWFWLCAMLALSLGYGAWLAWTGAGPQRWLGLDIAWQCWSMCALGAIALLGRMDAPAWGWAALCAVAFAIGDPLANHLHPFLISHGLYPSFWGRGNDPQQSAQYARLLVWSICAGLAWARSLRARVFPRSAQTAIALLGASSVLATSAIFHVAIISMAKHYEGESMQQARAMMHGGAEGFKQWCAATGAICAAGPSELDAALAKIPEIARGQAKSSWDAVWASGTGSFANWRQPTQKETFNRLPSMMAAASVSASGEPRLWADMERLARDLSELEKVFAWLALWAHGFWLWGSVYLSWWHGKKSSRRKAGASPGDAAFSEPSSATDSARSGI